MGETVLQNQQQQQQEEEAEDGSRESHRLSVAEFKTVQWIGSQESVKRALETLAPRYLALRKTYILGWILIFYESVAIWWWSFLHNLSWPPIVLSLLGSVDGLAVILLENTAQRLEWWWDVAGVRLMWFRESVLSSLDHCLTKIDVFLLLVQDKIIGALTFFLRPLVIVYRRVVPKRETMVRSRMRDDHNDQDSDDDQDDDEEFYDEYFSDASTDSRRLLKGGPQGGFYGRHCTSAMAEGKFREAMYRRVKNELRLMRKNSVRLSYGLVTYARQMVEPRVRPYADSFQASCQKWAREHEMQETMRPLQEEWGVSRPPLAKMISLAQALCVVCLAFLLRLVKGKKSRRTRSMRSESLRRRAQNLTCPNNNQMSLSPTALQQSSEPAPSHSLPVPESLKEAALREDDEDLDGSPAKDSALGSEDNRSASDQLDSDHTISPIEEEHDTEDDTAAKCKDELDLSEMGATCSNMNIARVINNGNVRQERQKKGVTILTPKTQRKQGLQECKR